MTTLAGITHSDREIMSGATVFVGTRVPVRSLFDYLGGGETGEEFLRQFSSVKRQQVIAVLKSAREKLPPMRLLLDQNFPVDFAAHFAEHEAFTVIGLG